MKLKQPILCITSGLIGVFLFSLSTSSIASHRYCAKNKVLNVYYHSGRCECPPTYYRYYDRIAGKKVFSCFAGGRTRGRRNPTPFDQKKNVNRR